VHLETGVYEMISADLCVAGILVRNDMYECMLVISTSIGLTVLASSRREPNCKSSLKISACPSSNFKSWEFQFNNWTTPFSLRPVGSNFNLTTGQRLSLYGPLALISI